MIYYNFYNIQFITKQMYLHIGTYDGNIITFKGILGQFEIYNSFQASQTSIRTLHRHDKYLLAGGFDQIVHIYDMNKNKQVGEIQANQGIINQITSYGDILITAGYDGTIKLWKMKSWNFLHLLKEHKNQVESVALHPSGKMMFSIGKDKKLILWNLLKALRVFDKRIQYQVNKILLYQQCKNIILISNHQINILETTNNKEIRKISVQYQKFQDSIIYQNYLIASTQSGQIYLWNLENEKQKLKFITGNSRVKVLQSIIIGDYGILITASSNGQIKFWDIDSIIKQISNHDSTNDIPTVQFETLDELNINQRIITIQCVVEKQQNTIQHETKIDLANEQQAQIEVAQQAEQQQKIQVKKVKKIKKTKKIGIKHVQNKLGQKKKKKKQIRKQ